MRKLFTEEFGILKYLEEKGYEASPVVWNDEKVDFKSFDLLVMRTVWDYVSKYDEFCEWLDKIKESDVKMLNSCDFLKWNVCINFK